MRFGNALNQDEQVAGLEISSAFLRLCLIETDGKTGQKKVVEFLAQPLPEATLVAGEIKNHSAFIAAINELKKNIRTKVRYVIVSIPSDSVYFRWTQFPRSLSAAKLKETMDTFLNFQLPGDKAELYADWQSLEQAKQWDTFVAAARKSIINPYIDIISATGFTPVAIEFHPVSIARAVELPKDQAVLLTTSGAENSQLFVVKNGTLLFNRLIPAKFSKQLPEEIRKVSAFFESENQAIKEVVDHTNTHPITGLTFPEGFKGGSEWLTALGAALRGALPRSEDKILSLMSTNTQKAYAYQKAINYSTFLAHLTISLAIFFSAAYIGTWLMLLSLQQSTAKSVDILNNQPIQATSMETEEKIRRANTYIAATSSIIKTSPEFSILIAELKEKVTEGITITNLSLSPNELMTIAGVSRNRPELNAFKKSLESSELLTNVALPLTNLQQKDNIPFSVSFELRDIDSIYPK